MNLKKHYKLLWDDNSLSVEGPPSRCVQNALTYTEKSMVPDPDRPYRRKVRKRRTAVYTRIDMGENNIVYLTHQGFLETVIGAIAEEGGTFKIYDNRAEFPEPMTDRMSGFRYGQRELLEKALGFGRSGLLVAVTRYGKTAMMANVFNAYPGMKSVLIAPGIDLLPQLEDSLRYFCPDRDIRGIYTGSKGKSQSDDITVCSVDSIEKLDFAGTRLVVIDEPHTIATGSRAPELAKFERARIIGMGATVEGRWEGNDIMLTGLIGPRLAEKTYTEAVREGAICPVKVRFIKIPFRHFRVADRDTAYRRLHGSNAYLKTVAELANSVIPDDWQTLFFISTEKQGEVVKDAINDENCVLAMDKLMKKAGERKEMFRKLKTGEITRCVCSNIYSTGVTIDGIRAAVNCAFGGGSIMSVQKPGRLAEIKEGKKAGYMFDFMFEPKNPAEETENIPWKQKAWTMVVNDCWARYNVYRDKGYDVKIVDSVNELEKLK